MNIRSASLCRLFVVLVVIVSAAVVARSGQAQSTPMITDVSGSNTPNGYAGYIRSGQSGFQLISASASFGSTPGRVMLGTTLHYADTPAPIAQTVTAWSASTVTVTIATGGLAHGTKAFIFVVTSSGTATLGFPVYVQATTPTITAVSSSSLTHGSTLTISGHNFGLRPDYHPDPDKLAFMWSTFDDDTYLFTNPYRSWGGSANNDISWRNTSPRTSLPGDGFYRRVDGSDTTTGALETTIGNHGEYYYAGWVRMNVTYSSTSGQIKFFRQWSSGSQQPNWYPSHRQDSGWLFTFEFHQPEVRNSCQEYEFTVPVNGNQWVFFEMYMKRATGPDTRDGEMWFKINNRLAFDWYKNFSINQTIPCYTTDNSGEFDDDGTFDGVLQAGPSYAEDWTAASYVDADDILYDASQARVVVGNASTFRGSSTFEVQPPISWSDTAIQVRLNRGAHASLAGKWLYVVDRFGFVNENGFALSTTTPTPTSTPTAVPPVMEPVIAEDFSTNFTVVAGGTWSVTGGSYLLMNPAFVTPHGNVAVHNTPVVGDFSLEADGRVSATGGAWDDFSIIFNFQDANNYYFASFNERNDAYTHGIFKYAGGTLTQIADFTTVITPDTTYSVKVEKIGSTIKVYRNGVLQATATDPTFTGGKVGFGTRDDTARFDNLVVRQ